MLIQDLRYAWAPSMLYTVINETTGNLDMAMFSVCIFLYASLPFLLSINLTRAKRKALQHNGERRRCTLKSPNKSFKNVNQVAPAPEEAAGKPARAPAAAASSDY